MGLNAIGEKPRDAVNFMSFIQKAHFGHKFGGNTISEICFRGDVQNHPVALPDHIGNVPIEDLDGNFPTGDKMSHLSAAAKEFGTGQNPSRSFLKTHIKL